jgi:hypothetical protein
MRFQEIEVEDWDDLETEAAEAWQAVATFVEDMQKEAPKT